MPPTDEPPTDPSDRGVLYPTRRRVLQTAAAAGALSAIGLPASAQEATFELDGDVAGWEGRAPADIEGETNPPLELEEGQTYVVEWENVDGEPHNFVIEDADGNHLVETEVISGQGETQTVEFEATRAMAEYYCEVHPASMRGDVVIGEAPEGDGEDDEAGRFFRQGTTVGVSHVAEGMTAPTDFAMAADGRMYVTDQTGEVWVVDDDGRRDDPAVDVRDRMIGVAEEFHGSYADPMQDYDERGLLGIELHPEFEDNGRLFLHYSAPPNDETPDGWDHVEVVSEFAADVDAGTIDPDSERELMTFQKPQYNHDAGPMAFGPDGYLYVPMGDGGGANDDMYGHVDDWYDANAGGNGQNTTENLLGGVHRIDVDDEGDDRPYAVPDDNPLVDEEGHLPEYYAWGFRNPFGISFDSDGRLFVADAGQNLFEEADLVEAGGNYGWNVKEGTHCFSTDEPTDPPDDCPDSTPDDVRGGEPLLDPIVEYPHTYQGRSVGIVIVGGHVYEADAISGLQGKYVFGDWSSDTAREAPQGRLFAAAEPAGDDGDGGGDDDGDDDADQVVPRDRLWDMEELVIAGSDDGQLHRFVRQFGQGPDGEVYVLVNERGTPEGDTGAVLQLVPPGEGDPIDGAGVAAGAVGERVDDVLDDLRDDVPDLLADLPPGVRDLLARLRAYLQ